jgi:hypothetical protein
LVLNNPAGPDCTSLSVRPPDDALNVIERAITQGDLSVLSPGERATYYVRLCESLDLNPLTRPFAYLRLGGELRLYALKDCTEQLRRRDDVSITIVARETTDDVYVVTAQATIPAANGHPARTDESIGAVSIAGLRGDAKANALMKAETKAKRRVTLSICGLGIPDETEVADIPGAVILQDSDVELPSPAGRAEVVSATEVPTMAPSSHHPGSDLMNEEAINDVIHALAQRLTCSETPSVTQLEKIEQLVARTNLAPDVFADRLQARYGVQSTNQLTPEQADEVISKLEAHAVKKSPIS